MIKPSFLFTDNGMLQRDSEVRVFGECDSASVTVSFCGYSSTATVTDGHFTATLPKMPAGLTGDLVFKTDDEELRLANVITGDIWLAGGQSNMEHPTFCAFHDDEDIARDEKIRVFTVPRRPYPEARNIGWHFFTTTQEDTPWEVYDEASALTCSAVAAFFAKRLRKDVDVPIGILNCNLGASTAEAWVSREALLADDVSRYAVDQYDKKFGSIDVDAYHSRYLEFVEKLRAYDKENGSALDFARREGVMAAVKGGFKIMIENGPYYYQTPCTYYNTMISRLSSLAIKGVIWYQGESNSHDNPPSYSHKEWVKRVMRTLFANWRSVFKNDSLPFYLVQLSAYGEGESGKETRWVNVRAAHDELALDDGVYTVVSHDIGEADNIHPANKKPVGERLALAALANEYGLDVQWESPRINTVKKRGNDYVLTFKGAKYITADGVPSGFFVTAKDGTRTAADARLEDGKVVISYVGDASAISFMDQHYAYTNVYNEVGLPPFPFQYDL